MEDIRQLSINELIRRLHESISGFVSGMESVIAINRLSPEDEISSLRSDLVVRLREGKEVADNKKVIGLLDLLSKDQAVLDLVKEDAKDWLQVIETIEDHMENKGSSSAADASDIRRIKNMAFELKRLIREE